MICHECEQEIVNSVITAKDVISLNKKLLGRQIKVLFCAVCLAEYLETTIDALPEMVEQFKEQGCKLF